MKTRIMSVLLALFMTLSADPQLVEPAQIQTIHLMVEQIGTEMV